MTIARELMLQVAHGAAPGMPSAHVIRLCRSGALAVEGPVAAGGGAVSRAAQLLESLLPPRNAGPDAPEFKVPGALRLCIVRALGTLDVPPYPSLESFADALQRFAAPDPAAAIRALVEAWDAAAVDPGEVPVPAPQTQDVETAPSPAPSAADDARRADIARRRPDPPAPAALVRRSEPLTISDIRRARRATGLPLAEISSRSRIPVSLLRQLEWGYVRNWPSGLPGRTELVRYARAAGLDDQIVIATVWPMLDEAEVTRQQAMPARAGSVVPPMHSDSIAGVPVVENDDLPLVHDPVVPSVVAERRGAFRRGRTAAVAAAAALALAVGIPFTLDRLADPRSDMARSSGTTEPALTPANPIAAPSSSPTREPAPVDPQPQPPDRNEIARATVPEARPPAPTAPGPTVSEASRASLTSAATEPARGLTDAETAWSPAFAAAGSAMFYHARGESGSALMRADTDDEGAILRITRVVDDNAQNFHARPSPDGTRIAFDSDRDGARGVYVADADGTNVRRVSGEGFAAVPSWSPDGRLLAFVRGEPDRPRVWNLWSLDLTTGDLRRLTSHRYGQPWGGSWFPDSRRLAYSHEDRLVVLDIVEGRERVYPSPRKGQLVRTPAVSPDGRRIIFQVFRDGAWLLDVPDGGMRKVLADPTAEEYTWSPDGRRVAYHSRRSGEWGVWLMAAR